MQRRQGITLTVCLACCATLAGHWWLTKVYDRRMERLTSASSRFQRLLTPAEKLSAEEGERAPMICIDPPSPDEVMAAFMDDKPAASPPRLLTSATYEESSDDADKPADALPPTQPGHIPSRSLTPREREALEAVRDVIEAEMPGVSADERDIWFEELKSLPPEAVRDLLKVRQQMRILSPNHALAGPSRLFPAPDRAAERETILAEPVTRSLPLSPEDWSESRDALQQAIAWSTHNLANAATPGYKRLRVLLTDAYHSRSTTDDHTIPPTFGPGAGCRIASLSLDTDQAPISESGRELDVAIDGSGFFLVYHEPTSRQFYTRCGAWKLTADRRLALAVDDAEYLLDLKIRMPVSATEIRIAPNGQVLTVNPDGSEPVAHGQLKLARLSAPSQLLPQGGGLLITRENQEPALETPGTAGLGVLRQHALEQSNVDIDFELAERKLWQNLLEHFPTGELPRTARHGFRSPQ